MNLLPSTQNVMRQDLHIPACDPSLFTLDDIFGTDVVRVDAQVVQNLAYSTAYGRYTSHEAQHYSALSFCNVSVIYTHPGQNDYINTQIWLPTDTWNGRLQGSGGGGFQTGLDVNGMMGAIGQGFSVVSTDGGHLGLSETAEHWALLSPGNVNLYLLQDFASVALNESAVIGRKVVEQFYGSPPSFTYWNGCSTGGRQGLMFAQRYPDAWDGILAAAPAINFERLCTADFWPQAVLNDLGERPYTCELEAITTAAIKACDDKDGVLDGIISAPDLCNFDASSMLGKRIHCDRGVPHSSTVISRAAVAAADAVWRGVQDASGTKLWYGLSHEAALAGLASSQCDDGSNACKSQPFAIAESWIRDFILRGRSFNSSAFGQEDLIKAMHTAHQLYASMISTTDPDLSEFARRGGKMITWHGLADQLIPPNSTRMYYESVKERDPNVVDFYRIFEAPGLAHCFGGPGLFPYRALEELMDWVENGHAPTQLMGRSLPDPNGRVLERPICQYPTRAQYDGWGSMRDASSWSCKKNS